MPNPRALIITADNHECKRLIEIAEALGFYTLAAHSLVEFRQQMREFKPDTVLLNTDLIQSNLLDFLLSLPGKRSIKLGLITADEQITQWTKEAAPRHVRVIDRPINPTGLRAFLRQVIKSEDRRRRRKPVAHGQFELLVGSSPAMQDIYTQIAKVAPTDATILICGQSGTGKELVAQSIHNRSQRHDKRFLAVNCGAIPDSLIESELFGCEKGSYTGADKMRKGVFERANHGTLFLDEITEMAMEAQIRLLRILEERAVTRIGGDRPIKLDVRVIAATNRDSHQAIADGQLREDLHYRLAVFPLAVPPLAQRGEDVIMLANHFLSEHNKSQGTDKTLSELGLKRLLAYNWPGNVRQLRNAIYRAFILEENVIDMQSLVSLIENGITNGTTQTPDDPTVTSQSMASTPMPPEPHVSDSPDDEPSSEHTDESLKIMVGTTLDEADRQLIFSTLEQCDNNRTLAAKMLGISIKTLYNKLQKYEAE
jgi:DNA-binding NtrC family response regulator